MKNPVGWFEIYVSNMERAKAFYQAVLKVELNSLSDPTDSNVEMWAFPSDMDTYGASGTLVKMKGFESGKNSVLVYFSCEDCAVEASRVEKAGGELQQPKFAIGEYGFCALAVDTEGNMFGLHSMK